MRRSSSKVALIGALALVSASLLTGGGAAQASRAQ
jgi:hypothetical protein